MEVILRIKVLEEEGVKMAPTKEEVVVDNNNNGGSSHQNYSPHQITVWKSVLKN